jgi:hypothetical protein
MRPQNNAPTITVRPSDEPLDVEAWVRLYVRYVLASRGVRVHDPGATPLPRAS